jgi:hypothetical protein
VRRLLRKLLGIEVRFGREDAIRIAREHSSARGWPWNFPVRVNEGLREYVVWTNADCRGGNSIIHVDVTTGVVTSATITPC